jgi:hypothetical protein
MEDTQYHMHLEDSDDYIHVSIWDDNKVWMNVSLDRASARVVLTKDDTRRLIEMLQKAMAAGEHNA